MKTTNESATLPTRKLHRHLIAFFWFIAAILAGIQAWESRHTMNPDGMSYLDVADAYLREDWGTAINAYWSPFYSWLLGLMLGVLKPSPYWEFSVVHLANFLIFVWTMACFHFFLRELIQYRWYKASSYGQEQTMPLPDWTMWALGYSIFIWCSISLISLGMVTPDMCVAAFVYLASAIILRIQTGQVSGLLFGLLGAVLGFGYLAKLIMFPLAFIFLGVSLFSVGKLRKAIGLVLVALVVFLSISGPFIFALSKAKGRLTFGDAGKLNWDKDGGMAMQLSARKLMDDPVIYEFTKMSKGSYPLQYDPSYWYEGNASNLNPNLNKSRLRSLKQSAGQYFYLFSDVQEILLLGFLIFYLISRRGWNFLKDLSKHWSLFIPALAALAIYSLVHVEWRFVCAFVVLLWLGVAGAFRFPQSEEATRIAGCVCKALVLVMMIKVVGVVNNSRSNSPDHVQWQIADRLSQIGIQPGDRVASIGESYNAYWARLGRTHIVAEIPRAQALNFWNGNPFVKWRAIESLASTGAKVIVAANVPDAAPTDGWQRLGNTDYYVYKLREIGDSRGK